ncbi:retrovirus-related pol polyprotein from transposon TNT 1-94 [Tanacetum coccineum]
MLNNQKPSGEKLGLGFNSFEASSSETKEIKFVKAQKKESSDRGPINMGGPLSVQAPPKAIMGPPPAATPASEKSVSFQKSILGPRPKHIIVNNAKVPVASDNEICLGVDLEPDEWIKDSGCSKRMTGQICDNKCRVAFSEHDSEITKDGKVIGRGIRKKGLYVMKLRNKPKDQICLATIDENSTLWHRRLGHANMRLIQLLASKELVRNLPKLKFDQHFCDACKTGKQAHARHKAKNIVSTTRCLELLHMDLFSPSDVRSYGGNRYTLVIVNDYSMYTWTRFLKDKTKAFDQFEIFSKKIQNQLGCTIVLIRTDHGREFDNEVQFGEFCNGNGITQNFSAPRTPQSNGVVERKNRTLQEIWLDRGLTIGIRAVKKLESQLKASHKQQSSLNEKLNFQANQIFEKVEKAEKYRRIGMKLSKTKRGCFQILQMLMPRNLKEEMSRGIFVLRETDEGYYDIPLYSRFKQVEYKGVPPPLSGDYTPRAQEDIDDSFNEELGVVSDASSTHYSTCQSNDSDGELGTVTDHSVNDDSIPIPSSEQNWNQRMERELGAGYSFERKPCFVCGSLSHLIKDCDYYEKKMAREAAFKSTRVVHANVRQATRLWLTLKKELVGLNGYTVMEKCSSVSSAGTQFKSGASRFNTGKQHVNSGRMYVNSGTQNKSGGSRDIHGRYWSIVVFLIVDVLGDMTGNWEHLEDYQENSLVGNSYFWRERKGIKQEFSNARTPQQNGVAERMNRTLIEAARTMLADSHLPTTFWAEAVNTACYTFNRVRVTKPQNKTPYELLFGHKPILSYIRPFGCHVTILNTLSPLGKFDGKSDEGFLVGYSVNSKAFRGIGHRWMFDLDYLTDSMNYIPVSLQNQANPADCYKEDSLPEAAIFYTNIQDSSKQGLVIPPTTKTHASGEEQVEEISPNTLEAAKTLSKVASLKSRSIDKGRRYKRRKETKGKKVVSSLDFQEDVAVAEKINTAGEINAASIEVNTASKVNTGSIELNTVIEQGSTAGENKGQREGKAPMLSEETPKKSKEQILQEEASLAEAIRLDSLQKEEEAKQIHLDALLAQRIAEEEELTEQQKKRKAQVQFEAQYYTNEDWDMIRTQNL